MIAKLLFFVFLAGFCFFAVYSLLKLSFVTKTKKDKKPSKNMTVLQKRAVFAAAVGFLCGIILQNIIFGLIAAALYFYFSWYAFNRKTKKAALLTDKQVIEALTIIKNAIQSGQSLQMSIDTAYRELNEPIKSEFRKMSESLALGISFDKVLLNASDNAAGKEFKLMIDTIRISKDTGASLSGIFDRITDSANSRLAINSKVEALTSQGKLSGNIVSVIPFIVIVMMYLIEPSMMESLFTTLAGNIILLIVVAMVLCGSFVINKLTEIDF